MLVAGVKLRVKTAAGVYEDRKPGDPVPEAAGWPNLASWLAQKMVVEVPDVAPKAAAVKPQPVPNEAQPSPKSLEAEAPRGAVKVNKKSLFGG